MEIKLYISIYKFLYNVQTIVQILTENPPEKNTRRMRDINALCIYTKEMPLLSEIGITPFSDNHKEFCLNLRYQFVGEDQYIYRNKDIRNKFYIIIHGKCGIYEEVPEYIVD